MNGFRGETSTVNLMEKRVEADLWYVSNWSFWLDLRILWKTLTVATWQASPKTSSDPQPPNDARAAKSCGPHLLKSS